MSLRQNNIYNKANYTSVCVYHWFRHFNVMYTIFVLSYTQKIGYK